MSVDSQTIKTYANFIRHNYIELMQKEILNFESIFSKNGFQLKWIENEEYLVQEIKQNLPAKSYNKVCFDLDYIPDSFFSKKNQINKVEFENRDSFTDLVVKADFAVLDIGALVFLNKKSTVSFNKVSTIHVILDINNIVAKYKDLEVLLYLKYNSNCEDTSFPADIKFLKRPFKQYNIDENGYYTSEIKENSKIVNIILYVYDNGVTDLLSDVHLRETLYCINCGKCKEVCPLCKVENGLSPIEKLKNNFYYDDKNIDSIFAKTTLCGNCNEVCPVQIPFTDLFIYEMQKIRTKSESRLASNLQKTFLKRSKMNKLNNRIRRYFHVQRYYRKNKKLLTYYLAQKDDFYNVFETKQIEYSE